MYLSHNWLDVLTGSSLVSKEDERYDMLENIIDRRWAIVIGAACVAATAVAAVFITRSAWPYYWVVVDLILTAARWKVMADVAGATLPVRRRSWRLLAIFTLCWSAMFGVAIFYLVYSGDQALLIIATVLTISVSSAMTYRNAAMPRAAILAISLVTLPFLAGLFVSLIDQRWIAFAVGIPLLLSSYSLTTQNHQILVRLIAAERQARALAHTDPLTGLPNRLSFARHQETLAAMPAEMGGYAYMCLDLDEFKHVNDRYGHPAGDLLLKAVAERLRQKVRSGDIVFRIGGDEFIVYMPGARPSDCAFVASRIIASLTEPFALSDDLIVSIGCSAGSACLTNETTSASRILHVADEALYKAKRDGKSRHVHAAIEAASLISNPRGNFHSQVPPPRGGGGG